MTNLTPEAGEAAKRIEQTLADHDVEVEFELANQGERADLWTDIDANAEDLRTLLAERAALQARVKVLEGERDEANALLLDAYGGDMTATEIFAAHVKVAAEAQVSLLSAELERAKKRLLRYENWQPMSVAPSSIHLPKDVLIHFFLADNEYDTWISGTWDEAPASALAWCAIVSPLGPTSDFFDALDAARLATLSDSSMKGDC